MLNSVINKPWQLGGMRDKHRERQGPEKISWVEKGSPGALPWLDPPVNRRGERSWKKGCRNGQTAFSSQDGPEPALLDLGLSREQLEPCLDLSEYLSVEHFHCTAVWGWLVKTWDTCIIQNPLGDKNQLGPYEKKKSLAHQRRTACFVKKYDIHRKTEQSSL